MTPTIGRIVHYTNLGDADGKFPPAIQAAIITGLRPGSDGDLCMLHIFYENGQFDMVAKRTDEPAGSKLARGMWSWPEKVPQ